MAGLKTKQTLYAYLSSCRLTYIWVMNALGMLTIVFSIVMSVLILDKQGSQSKMIYNYMYVIGSIYNMFISSKRAVFHNTEIYAYFNDFFDYPFQDMNKAEYFSYEQIKVVSYGEQFYSSYRQLQKDLILITNGPYYYQILYNVTLKIKNLILDDRFFMNDTINNVMSNIITDICLIGVSPESFVNTKQVIDYMQYTNWNVHNPINWQLENMLDNLLVEILDLCDISKSFQIIAYYCVAIVGVFLIIGSIGLFIILTYHKKLHVYELLLHVHPKICTMSKEECISIKCAVLVSVLHRTRMKILKTAFKN